MARVQLFGMTFTAKPIEQNPDGSWLMEAQQHGPRFSIGTTILVHPKEILSMDEAEVPAAAGAGLVSLQAAMDKERETLTPVAELLKAAAPKE